MGMHAWTSWHTEGGSLPARVTSPGHSMATLGPGKEWGQAQAWAAAQMGA